LQFSETEGCGGSGSLAMAIIFSQDSSFVSHFITS
jgi:hypothetical protein